MSTIWLEGLNDLADGPGRQITMPVFAGQRLVVVGGSSGIGREARRCGQRTQLKARPGPYAGPATRHTGRRSPATPRTGNAAITTREE